MNDGFPMLSLITCKNDGPVFDLTAPLEERVKKLKEVRDAVALEHNADCEMDVLGDVDAGVLMGALNLLNMLLEGHEDGLDDGEDDEGGSESRGEQRAGS